MSELTPETLLQIADSPRSPALSEPLRAHLRQCAAVWREHLRLLDMCRDVMMGIASRRGATPEQLAPFLKKPEYLIQPPADGPSLE